MTELNKKQVKKILQIILVVFILLLVVFNYPKYEYTVSKGSYAGGEWHYTWTDKIVLESGEVFTYDDIGYWRWNLFLEENAELIEDWGFSIPYKVWVVGDFHGEHYKIERSHDCDYYCNYFKNGGKE